MPVPLVFFLNRRASLDGSMLPEVRYDSSDRSFGSFNAHRNLVIFEELWKSQDDPLHLRWDFCTAWHDYRPVSFCGSKRLQAMHYLPDNSIPKLLKLTVCCPVVDDDKRSDFPRRIVQFPERYVGSSSSYGWRNVVGHLWHFFSMWNGHVANLPEKDSNASLYIC